MGRIELVGFDCKIWGPKLMASWGQARRKQYLLRPEVDVPLSVDILCWPSALDTGEGSTLPTQERERLGLLGVPVSEEFVGPFAPYWTSLKSLEAEITRHYADPQQCKIVQVIKCVEVPELEGVLKPGFEPLGYDVAGLGFCSSLSNCGYSPEEQAGLIRRFGDRLNNRHLFAAWSSAAEFVTVSNRLVPEHAPFAAYLLSWRLPA